MSAGAPGPPGLVIAAPASGSGKTVVTLGLLRALSRAGRRVVSFKAGPDYIDPAFHAAATGRPCHNLDTWAMRPATLTGLVAAAAGTAELAVCEGVMGLFDGAADGSGSTADLAVLTGWPVILVIDARAQAASAAAVLRGFASHRPDVRVAGVIFNRVGGAAHEAILRDACGATLPDIPVLGCLPREAALATPERHLGLVQAAERPDLEAFLDAAAAAVERHLDLAALLALAAGATGGSGKARPVQPVRPVPPPGQHIAVASDEAFAFCYAATLDGWRAAGATVTPFSPLAGEGPDGSADAVWLPGGYPELHAGRLAGNGFLPALCAAAARGAAVIGECGGYMVLGRGLVDADGQRHEMAGLLPLETSFAERRLHLGYREATATAPAFLAGVWRGHEFHYATIVGEGPGTPLFQCRDARGADTGPAGLVNGRVAGSFIHLVERHGAA